MEMQPRGPRLEESSLAGLTDPGVIQEHLDRLQRAVNDDLALAIGSAKELIESTAKTVLIERGTAVDERTDLPVLVKEAQQALGLHPSSATLGPDGTEAVRKILGGVSSIAIGVAELRNRGYGTGHGGAGARAGLSKRHAHLAVNAAITWCQLMLDTLTDPAAPWRQT
ncbi:abortive infection family protein [Arthrobacter sp. U41]|uniref:abortive infection family protein n=1 Tax=Arthrobacter sp. U41 TaxID=1849032 RepID=UPI0018D4CA87|nr:abortive infection family protein [Arthrobacter sp. U41]